MNSLNEKNSYHIKYAVMHHYRFKRGMICASEFYNADVMAYEAKYNRYHEFEIKTTKQDMWKGESRKDKHMHMKDPILHKRHFMPHKFYMTVPKYLLEEAEKWVKETNTNYGIIVVGFSELHYLVYNVEVYKKAKIIHNNEWKSYTLNNMMKRVSSENINLIEGHFKNSDRYEILETKLKERQNESTHTSNR